MCEDTRNRRPKRRSRIQHRRGAALTEFAVVAPFIVVMLMGMLEFGRVMMVQQALTSAAREAAREATLPSATDNSV